MNESVHATAAKWARWNTWTRWAGVPMVAFGLGALCSAVPVWATEVALGDGSEASAARWQVLVVLVLLLLLINLVVLWRWKQRRDASSEGHGDGMSQVSGAVGTTGDRSDTGTMGGNVGGHVGRNAGGESRFFGNAAQRNVPTPDAYRSENVGNDASARPWERTTTAFVSVGASNAGCACLTGGGMEQMGDLRTCGLDTAEFLALAKKNYLSLQAAWDRCDTDTLRAMMTPAMREEIGPPLADCANRRKPRATDVVAVEARLIGVRDESEEYRASVEFSGMIREDAAAGPVPFREIWTMTMAKQAGAGWLLAGFQAMQ
ncbi:Tim44 domain-containing protein [Candidatus Symbiobacter mobilis]|uniref:Tim44-like domain-containing protein n=1 Tax=Candidatus Symbiobacter mobilis CR TaxID=946483 RepID=U5N7W6_9BURK|nr:Tim44-like domain-containing protein [Candidatus Symbiobacter mobilis]AGX86343.1 hypothetical protein Cenrod_0215 [Candidatus Symbiobacter mobilis CR]